MNTDSTPPSLDPRARELLAAYREQEPPTELRERVWSRIESAAEAPAPTTIPRVLGIALGLAAGFVLVFWIVAAVDREAFAPRSRDAAMQAQDDEASPSPARVVHDARGPSAKGPAAPSEREPEPPTSAATAASSSTAPREDADAASSAAKKSSMKSAKQSAKQPARGAPPTRQAESAPLIAGPQLAQEQAVLERGWSALREGRAARALAEAEEHARRFPSGVLEPEREALRVAARCQLSPPERSERLAAFTRAQPRSPLLSRVQSACASE